MSFATPGSLYQLTMSMSGDEQGWSEKLYLPEADLALALAKGEKLARLRLNCLPSVCDMVWARISLIGVPRDAHAVLNSFPAPGLYNPGGPSDDDEALADHVPNLTTDAVRYRLETAEGPWSMRFLHGVPDEQIAGDALVDALALTTAVPADPTTVDATATSWPVLAGTYLNAVRTLTKWARIRIVDEAPVIETADIFKLIVRGVEFKKTGRPFGQRRGRATPR